MLRLLKSAVWRSPGWPLTSCHLCSPVSSPTTVSAPRQDVCRDLPLKHASGYVIPLQWCSAALAATTCSLTRPQSDPESSSSKSIHGTISPSSRVGWIFHIYETQRRPLPRHCHRDLHFYYLSVTLKRCNKCFKLLSGAELFCMNHL